MSSLSPSPPGPTSPLSPAGASNNPISFRTNVNRAKTKRWVEAKQYSYDGGEWGDEDEEDEKPQEAPQPPDATHRRGSSELSSRRLSDLALGSDGSRASPSAEAQSNPGGGDQKVLPFIRPADIYKRMREERSSVDSGRSTEAPQSSEQPGSTPTPAVASYPEASKAGGFNSSATTNNAPIMGLPELKRISAFGTDFLDGGDSNVQQNANPASLQHNPSQGSSQGFRSMVHQAFDAPETPNSTAGSVERSNSDGTSTVSSVMGNRGWYDYKTPTIFEDPAESTSPTAMAEAPEFKPDHRRDTSLPEGGNSPSKRPVVTEQILPASSYADVSTASPPVHHDDQSEEQAPPSAERDFVAPLKFGSSGNATAEGYRGDVSTIVPNAENSPQDADSERLREEIIRSLSRPSSQEAEELQVQAAKEELIPHQYENQRGDGQTQSGPNLEETPRALVSESHPDWTGSHPLSQDPYEAGQAGQDPAEEAAPASSGAPTRPRMSRRFSWESSSSNGDPASQAPGDITAPPPLSAALASQEPEPIPGAGTESVLKALSGEAEIADSEISDDEKVEKPRLSIVPPVADGSPPQQIRGPVDGGQRDPLLATVGSADIDESKLQGFREILTITIPEERIRAFNRIRDQFAAMNTGLNHWIEFTVHDHPDHADLIQSSQGLSADVPRSSPTTRRFPKLTSFGNLAARDDNAPANADHNRRPSGHMGTKVVEQRGKEFLHTAGTFSGKAGEAAKGLFAKGRSKFRPSGDKVET